MFKDTCVVTHERIDQSPHINGLEITYTAAAPERDHLIMRNTINQNVTNMYYECMK
jgi:hypothetical protein